MGTLIRNGRVEPDNWQLLDEADAPGGGDERVIVPLASWRGRREKLASRGGLLGVLLEPADEPGAIRNDLGVLDLIAVRFPQFTDGRGYSIARLLRERYGWRGELRAVGDVQVDQLFYLQRCGFDAYLLRAGEDSALALAALSAFSESYQAAADQPLPYFRRRSA